MSDGIVGKRLKQAIEEAGYTVNKLAGEKGMPPQSTLQEIVSGETKNPKVDTLRPVAAKLGVTVEWLMGEDVSARPEYRQGWRDAIIAAERSLRNLEKPPKGEIDEGDPVSRSGEGRQKK